MRKSTIVAHTRRQIYVDATAAVLRTALDPTKGRTAVTTRRKKFPKGKPAACR